MLRTFAQIISVIFHPLLIVTYTLIILLLVNPYMFGVPSISTLEARILLLLIFSSTFFIPAFAVVMMRFLGLTGSIELKTKEDRILPYIATSIFYLAIFRFLLSDTNIPVLFKAFVLGSVLALFVAFFINLFSKVSMHTVGMGGLLAIVIITMNELSYDSFILNLWPEVFYQISLNTMLMGVIVVTGLVASARLLLNAHLVQDLLGGFIIGFGTQLLAFRIFSYIGYY